MNIILFVIVSRRRCRYQKAVCKEQKHWTTSRDCRSGKSIFGGSREAGW